jgi:hypothetical protein
MGLLFQVRFPQPKPSGFVPLGGRANHAQRSLTFQNQRKSPDELVGGTASEPIDKKRLIPLETRTKSEEMGLFIRTRKIPEQDRPRWEQALVPSPPEITRSPGIMAGMRTASGFRAHSGWAALLGVAGTIDAKRWCGTPSHPRGRWRTKPYRLRSRRFSRAAMKSPHALFRSTRAKPSRHSTGWPWIQNQRYAAIAALRALVSQKS